MRAFLRGAPVEGTRVVLASMPAMLADIVRQSLAAHGDARVVAEVDSTTALSRVLASTRAEVVVIGLGDDESPAAFADLLRVHPNTTLIAISREGRVAYHCAMRMVVSVTQELSLRQLLDALRARDGVDRELHLISFQWPIVEPPRSADN